MSTHYGTRNDDFPYDYPTYDGNIIINSKHTKHNPCDLKAATVPPNSGGKATTLASCNSFSSIKNHTARYKYKDGQGLHLLIKETENVKSTIEYIITDNFGYNCLGSLTCLLLTDRMLKKMKQIVDTNKIIPVTYREGRIFLEEGLEFVNPVHIQFSECKVLVSPSGKSVLCPKLTLSKRNMLHD